MQEQVLVADNDDRPFDPLDISSKSFWGQRATERAAAFEELRRDRPVSWHAPVEGGFMPTQRGFWAVTLHEDIEYVSRHSDLFCSRKGVSFEDVPEEMLPLTSSFLVMDPPRHTTMRRIVSGAFTRSRVKRLEDKIAAKAAELVSDAVEAGSVELVEALSTCLPQWTICEMMDVPDGMRDELVRNVNTMVAVDDPEIIPPGPDAPQIAMGAAFAVAQMGVELVAQKREDPGDDVLSAIAVAEWPEGGLLTEQEVGSVMMLLAVAGNDTTRNSISHGVHAFANHPEQWQRLKEDPAVLMSTAVEEVIRWGTPVIQFSRTATEDLELRGQPIRTDDKLVMFYESGNRDEHAFMDPFRFDVGRPVGHVGFGGGGAHYCLGAHLARTQLSAVFGELASRVNDFDVEEPEYLESHFLHAVKRMNVTFK